MLRTLCCSHLLLVFYVYQACAALTALPVLTCFVFVTRTVPWPAHAEPIGDDVTAQTCIAVLLVAVDFQSLYAVCLASLSLQVLPLPP